MNAAQKESPIVLKTCPSFTSMAVRRISSCRTRATRILSGFASQSFVLPSMSVNRKVRVPAGKVTVWLRMRDPRMQYYSPPPPHFLPGELLAITRVQEKRVDLWGARLRKIVDTVALTGLKESECPYQHAAFSPDGRLMASTAHGQYGHVPDRAVGSQWPQGDSREFQAPIRYLRPRLEERYCKGSRG